MQYPYFEISGRKIGYDYAMKNIGGPPKRKIITDK